MGKLLIDAKADVNAANVSGRKSTIILVALENFSIIMHP